MRVFKNIMAIAMLLGLSWSAAAQNFPEGIGYQAVVRDASGNVMASQNTDVMIRIISGTMTGQVEYEEEHSVQTDQFGHVSLVIGSGTNTGNGSVASLNLVDWSGQDMFVEVLVDETQSNNYTSVATTQFFAVPYAYYAKTTAQQFELNTLTDVDTTDLDVGEVLVWDGTQWVPDLPGTVLADTVLYAVASDSAIYADTASFAWNAQNIIPSDSANFAWQSDSGNYATTAGIASYTDTAAFVDTALYAMSAPNTWNLDGNSLLSGEFIGTTDTSDVIFKTNNTERMRITSTGRIGIGTDNPIVDLHLAGNSGFVYEATLGTGPSTTFKNDRLVWYPRKNHFYVGGGTIGFNDGNMGNYTFATGYNTRVEGDYSVSMGNLSWSRGEGSFSGGYNSRADGPYSFAYGRESQTNSGDTAAVAIGRRCLSYGIGSVSMGYHSEVYDDYSVAIGFDTRVNAKHSVALGYRSNVNHEGCFVFTDQSTTSFFNTAADNTFNVRAQGGTSFYTNPGGSIGVNLPTGGGSWTSLSDSTKKRNIVAVDVDQVLEKLRDVEVTEWSYKSQDESIRHIGPMAQDLYAAFGYGESDSTITTVDIDGINMAALQSLLKKAEALEVMTTQLEASQAEVAEMRAERDALEARVEKMEAMMQQLIEQVQAEEQAENSEAAGRR